MSRSVLPAASVGVGLRQPHYRELIVSRPVLGFVEVHSENFFLDGGASMEALDRACAAYPISLHGVGLSLGSATELAVRHLEKLKLLVERTNPALVSEHLCWGSADLVHFNDLLPLPYTHETLNLMVDRVDRVQSELKRQILVENVCAYALYRRNEFSEPEFLTQLADRTGCGLLLDINNLYVNAVNHGFSAKAWLDELPIGIVGETHLAGHTATEDYLIDTHGTAVCADVWTLYDYACRTLGNTPTLIEWDTDLPSLQTLLEQAHIAAKVQLSGMDSRHA